MLKLTEWEELRYGKSTQQLKALAKKLGLKVTDPSKKGFKQKERLATGLAILLGIPQDISDFHDIKERIVECCNLSYGFGALGQFTNSKNEEERTIRDICKMVKKLTRR